MFDAKLVHNVEIFFHLKTCSLIVRPFSLVLVGREKEKRGLKSPFLLDENRFFGLILAFRGNGD
jgi:hypothetical protein